MQTQIDYSTIVPRMPQRQDGTHDQLKDLHHVANILGMYDAADLLKKIIDRTNSQLAAVK